MFSKQMFAATVCVLFLLKLKWSKSKNITVTSELHCAEELKVRQSTSFPWLFSGRERGNEVDSAHDRITNLVLTARHQVPRKWFYHRSRLSWKPLKSKITNFMSEDVSNWCDSNVSSSSLPGIFFARREIKRVVGKYLEFLGPFVAHQREGSLGTRLTSRMTGRNKYSSNRLKKAASKSWGLLCICNHMGPRAIKD